MSQLTTTMVNWLEDMSAEKLINLELIFKRVRAIKGLISQKEKEIKSLDELFLGSLYGFNLNFTPYYLKTHPFLKRY